MTRPKNVQTNSCVTNAFSWSCAFIRHEKDNSTVIDDNHLYRLIYATKKAVYIFCHLFGQ